MLVERNLVLCLKRERILLHYQMLSHVQNKHVFSRSHHVQNSSVNYEEKNATQLAKLSDKWIKRFDVTIGQRSSSYNNTANN